MIKNASFLNSLYLIPQYRKFIVRLRLFFLLKLLRRIRFFQTDLAFETTISHNLKGLWNCSDRIELLIRPLSVIEFIDNKSEVLVIGPRNEHDLFYLTGHGFGKGKIRGLDLMSYSSWIDLGDMHATPYPENRFDVVMVGWTLSYSRDPQKFVTEMMRIVRNRGVLAIGVEYSTMTENDEVALVGYAIQETKVLASRINSVQSILQLFSPHVTEVYFTHDAPLKQSHLKSGLNKNVSNVAAIFRIKK
jgi:SAM-dependent methyltransferase